MQRDFVSTQTVLLIFPSCHTRNSVNITVFRSQIHIYRLNDLLCSMFWIIWQTIERSSTLLPVMIPLRVCDRQYTRRVVIRLTGFWCPTSCFSEHTEPSTTYTYCTGYEEECRPQCWKTGRNNASWHFNRSPSNSWGKCICWIGIRIWEEDRKSVRWSKYNTTVELEAFSSRRGGHVQESKAESNRECCFLRLS